MTKNHEIIKKITLSAILAALVVILAFLPIRTVALTITLTIIPIAIGGIVGGPLVGLFLGFVFGMTSFCQCFGYDPFGSTLFSINPFLTFLVCVPTRMIVGFFPAWLFSKISMHLNRTIAMGICCIIVPILNTLLFTSLLMICFYNTDFMQETAEGIGAINPIHFMVLLVGVNGLVEWLCGIFISFPVAKALDVVLIKFNNQ